MDFLVDKWYIASVSFGKDSLAMLLLILENLEQYPLNEVVFFDWGMEFQAIYRNRDKIIPILESKNIKFTELTPPNPSIGISLKKKFIKKMALYNMDILGVAA